MMEIKTCEQYVLQQLTDAQEQIASLEMQVADLRRDLAEATNVIEMLRKEENR